MEKRLRGNKMQQSDRASSVSENVDSPQNMALFFEKMQDFIGKLEERLTLRMENTSKSFETRMIRKLDEKGRESHDELIEVEKRISGQLEKIEGNVSQTINTCGSRWVFVARRSTAFRRRCHTGSWKSSMPTAGRSSQCFRMRRIRRWSGRLSPVL
mmetsp:Transcript_94761/g.305019  ORF Transcript_94761/g.305019 Transcript_94761/m.305019 type:complete len:156 (+) Transcript_94761:222-689(+)